MPVLADTFKNTEKGNRHSMADGKKIGTVSLNTAVLFKEKKNDINGSLTDSFTSTQKPSNPVNFASISVPPLVPDMGALNANLASASVPILVAPPSVLTALYLEIRLAK